MKIFSPTAFLLCMIISFSSCQDKILKTYDANVPIYMSYDEWRSMDFPLSAPQALSFPGNIYLKDQLLFVNELFKGLHVYDNSNPANPVDLGFIEIPGNTEIAMRNNILFLNSYYDLLMLDISDLQNPSLAGRIENAFAFDNPSAVPGFNHEYPIAEWNADKGVVVGWKLQSVTTESYPNFYYQPMLNNIDAGFTETIAVDPTITTVGISGSMAQFSVVGNYLYTLQQGSLSTYLVSNDGEAIEQGEIAINSVGETLFPAQGHLFIGTQWGMMIYSLQNPENPAWVSTYDHIVSCDPVIVQGDVAYVTLATGRRCWMGVNTLEAIDISNLQNPTLIKTYEMTNPQGLGIDNSTLFLCDKGAGLKVFDAEDPTTIDQNQLAIFPDIDTYDVIPYNDVLIMIGADGLYQYDYSDIQNITLLSAITIQ